MRTQTHSGGGGEKHLASEGRVWRNLRKEAALQSRRAAVGSFEVGAAAHDSRTLLTLSSVFFRQTIKLKPPLSFFLFFFDWFGFCFLPPLQSDCHRHVQHGPEPLPARHPNLLAGDRELYVCISPRGWWGSGWGGGSFVTSGFEFETISPGSRSWLEVAVLLPEHGRANYSLRAKCDPLFIQPSKYIY